MKKWILSTAFCLALPLFGQTQTQGQNSNSGNESPGSQVISQRTNQSGAPAIGTNATGQVSVDQLALQLQALRSSVEQTLPLLTEFNQSMGTTNGLAGALSGILNGVLGRSNSNGNTATSGQRLTNVLSAIGALVSTNNQGSVSIDQGTLRNLETLQRNLQPVADVMRNLNLGSTNHFNVPQTTTTPGGLTPTGR